MLSRLQLAASLLACGCGRINFDPLGGGGGDGGPNDGKLGDGNGGVDGTGPGVACVAGANPSCPMSGGTLSIIGNSSASGQSTNRGDGMWGSCGGAGADEHTLRYVVQQTGTYVFTTRGSNYDTVLYIRDGGCAGPELACNNNFGSLFTSQITLNLTAGQNVVAIIDGADGRCGNFSFGAGVNRRHVAAEFGRRGESRASPGRPRVVRARRRS